MTQFPPPGLLSQPPPNYFPGLVAKLKARNYQMECELRSLKDDYAKAIDDCVVTNNKIKKLEAEIKSKTASEDSAIINLKTCMDDLAWEEYFKENAEER